jgi:protein gp37
VWLGTTVENQKFAEKRVPALLAVPAIVHFVSCEPLLGPLDLRRWLSPRRTLGELSRSINWVIAGGESGGHARQMDPTWARALRDQCIGAGVPFHFKQWGVWGPNGDVPSAAGIESLIRLGKTKAGRVLDGRTWDGVPVPLVDARMRAAV